MFAIKVSLSTNLNGIPLRFYKVWMKRFIKLNNFAEYYEILMLNNTHYNSNNNDAGAEHSVARIFFLKHKLPP